MKDIDIIEPEETELQIRIKKVIKYVIGVFLLFIMLSYLIHLDMFGSLIEGKKISNYEIEYGNKIITFQPDVYRNLKTFYFQNQLTEVSFCLTGKIKENNYIIDSFYVPKTFFKNPITVSSTQCNEETIISMHTHPFNNCLLSQQDIVSYNEYHKYNPRALTGVMCDTDTFAFYGI